MARYSVTILSMHTQYSLVNPNLSSGCQRWRHALITCVVMKRTILLYSLAVAGAAFVLQWLEYKVAVRAFSTELYIVLLALGFTALGIWVGHHLTRGTQPPATEFAPNQQAIDYLGISGRELEVLGRLAEGLSNKEIAERLFVSPNTVKTHLANLYGKLEVSRRTQAIQKARELRLIP